MNRYLLLVFLLFISPLYIQAQSFWEKCAKETVRIRLENRKSDDPIYETGDTLYLFYDCTDSLQEYYQSSGKLLWKIREMTEEERNAVEPPEYDDIFSSDIWCQISLGSWRKPEILTFEDLKGIVLTSRKEFLDFYQREYVRKKGKERFLKREEKMMLSWFIFQRYFTHVYVIIPRSDWTFELYLSAKDEAYK